MLHVEFYKSAKLHFNNENIVTVYGQYIFKAICHARNENIEKSLLKHTITIPGIKEI